MDDVHHAAPSDGRIVLFKDLRSLFKHTPDGIFLTDGGPQALVGDCAPGLCLDEPGDAVDLSQPVFR